MGNLKCFFEPDGVALIGATEKMGFGYGQTKTLVDQNLGKRLFLINPSQSTIFGQKAYASILDIPDAVDLAILIVPAGVVATVLRECAARGVKAVIIQSAGFAEIGGEGVKRQEELTAVARETGLRIIGPNCVGLANTSNGFATTETVKEAMKPGPIGIIAQSGVFGNIVMDMGPEEGVYFSKVITLGNRCDVDESELIRYLGQDEQTRVITLYLEGVKDGRRFLAAVKEVAPRKPIVILKGGRTAAGKAATASHTGTLSGEDSIYAGAFAQSGVLRVRDIQELFDLSKSLALLPRPQGSRVAVLTTSGSLGGLTVDVCEDHNLPFAELSEETLQTVREAAPPWMTVKNPLDVGPSGLFAPFLKTLMDDPNVDGVIGIFLIPWMIVDEIRTQGAGAEMFLDGLAECRQWLDKKPFLLSVVGKREMRGIVQKIVGQEVPLISTPENAARVFASLVRYAANGHTADEAGPARQDSHV